MEQYWGDDFEVRVEVVVEREGNRNGLVPPPDCHLEDVRGGNDAISVDEDFEPLLERARRKRRDELLLAVPRRLAHSVMGKDDPGIRPRA